ncbi:Clavaminate synthase-like protein [Phlegmacium glaucopus]|nr:Clavaminate synthase-like protein [Phlegmacium glaucopus]
MSVVTVPYTTLLSSPLSLTSAIEEAFGSHPSSLGIIVIRDLPPEYAACRERLLKLSYKFAHLDENVRESYSDPTSKYSFGWSHGKEIMNGRPDTLKGSFYANPIQNDSTASPEERHAFPEYYGENIWPTKDEKGMEDFENVFKELSLFIFNVGCMVAAACQPFASSHLLDSSTSLEDLLRKSQITKARLLHYFPRDPNNASSTEDESIDNWCGFHLDHSFLTGLCPAMFLRHIENGEPEIVSPPSTSGLYIRTRGGNVVKVSIPKDCVAFQTGEALEIATNGHLLATPHCVAAGASLGSDTISRESFALFMQPNTDQHLSSSITFGAFSKRVFDEHYDTSNRLQ